MGYCSDERTCVLMVVVTFCYTARSLRLRRERGASISLGECILGEAPRGRLGWCLCGLLSLLPSRVELNLNNY